MRNVINLIYGKINFNVPFPPPYIREVWDYKNAKVENIQQSVSGIDLDSTFQGKAVNQKVNILNECLLNVFHNFIPNKKIKFNYKDPPWMTETVKSKLREGSYLVKRYYKNVKKVVTEKKHLLNQTNTPKLFWQLKKNILMN